MRFIEWLRKKLTFLLGSLNLGFKAPEVPHVYGENEVTNKHNVKSLGKLKNKNCGGRRIIKRTGVRGK